MKKLLFALLLASCGAHAGGLIANIPFDANSNILTFPLRDYAQPGKCPTADLTSASSGLYVKVRGDKSHGWVHTYTSAGSTLEGISQIGDYATPTATKARIAVTAAGACGYELQLPDADFSILGGSGGATQTERLFIEVGDGGSAIMTELFWVDQTVQSASQLVDSVWDEATSGHSTAGTYGLVLSTIPTTLTTLDTEIDALPTDVAAAVWNTVVEPDGAGTDITAKCALNQAFIRGAGLWTVSGNNATYKNPSGTDTRYFQTSTAASKTVSTITCP